MSRRVQFRMSVDSVVLNAIAEKLKRRSKDDFKVDLLRKSGEFPMSYEELDDTAATVYEGI
jgi:hypothetical protein